MSQSTPPQPTKSPLSPEPEVAFGANAVRLSPRQWIVAALVLALLVCLIPAAWERIETFRPKPDYRVPYALADDYWHTSRWFREASSAASSETSSPANRVLLVGDSVVWGHYVASDQTLSHYLNEKMHEQSSKQSSEQTSKQARFANLGVDGIHPAALAGLIEHHGRAIANRDVILNANLLWMSDRRRDLQTEKESVFNHPRLVPQFATRIPCYRENLAGRLGIVVERKVPLLGWVRHLQIAYFDNTSLPEWTIEHPYESPTEAVTLELPPADSSPESNAMPWTERGIRPANFPWVALSESFQWRSLGRAIEILQRRGNRVFVVVGPFNEHLLTDPSREAYLDRLREARAWLSERKIPHAVPEVLPSRLYADASHPLAEGYELLATQLLDDDAFSEFVSNPEKE